MFGHLNSQKVYKPTTWKKDLYFPFEKHTISGISDNIISGFLIKMPVLFSVLVIN
jgi:hypothetical protein